MAQQKQWPVFILAGVLVVAVVVIFGVVFLSSGRKTPSRGLQPAAPPRMDADLVQEIEVLKKVVAQDPENAEAWIKLGNNYYDANMPGKSIEAYGRALALVPDNPDVLTDQGVMFRRAGQPQRAVDNFRRVLALNPKHRVALLNLGVVLRYDLQDLKGAADVFRKYLSMGFGIGDDQVRKEIEMIEAVLTGNIPRVETSPSAVEGEASVGSSPEGMPPVAQVQRGVVVPPEVTQRWKGVRLLVREKDEEGAGLEYEVPVNGRIEVEGTGLTIEVGEFLPDFSMDATAITSRSADPNMPAVWMEVAEGSEKIFEGWIFSKMPEVHAFTHEKYQIVFQGPVARD